MTKSINSIEENFTTVAQLAVANPAVLGVFEKYNIDYCCGGHRSLEEACHRVGADVDKVKDEVASVSAAALSQALRPERWSSSLLIDFIVENHHTYVTEAIPEIQALLDKVCAAHGDDTPELLEIRQDFADLAEELTGHMRKEEFVLFPAIKRLEAQSLSSHPLIEALQTPIEAMEHEHDSAGALIKNIRKVSNNYTPPEFACPTFKITFKKLQEFDQDLMRHIHLENNILFERMKQPQS